MVFIMYMINDIFICLKGNKIQNIITLSRLVNSFINIIITVFICVYYFMTYDMFAIEILRVSTKGFYVYDTMLSFKHMSILDITRNILIMYIMNMWLPTQQNEYEGNTIVLKQLVYEFGNIFIYKVSYKDCFNKLVTNNDLFNQLSAQIIRIILVIYSVMISGNLHKNGILCVFFIILLLEITKTIKRITNNMILINL